MRKIGIIGYGVLGEHFHSFILEQEPVEVYFFDDIAYRNSKKNSYPFKDYLNTAFKELSFFVALGYKHLEKKNEILNEIKGRNLLSVSVTHNSAFVSPSARTGSGVLIYPKVNIDQNTIIEDGVLVHNSAIISHDSIIGAATYISPGVCICGNVTIGANCFIGAGTVISNDVKIGKGSIIGIGSVVTKNLPENTYAIGNPLKILPRKISLI